LEEKCRTIDARIEFFERPAVLAFVADGGFSVRILGKANPEGLERPGGMSEAFLNDLLNREELASLFNFLATNYPEFELVIDNSVASQKRVSIENALATLVKVVSGDVEANRKLRGLVEALAHSSVKNERGELVPYRLFMQLKNRLGLNNIDR
jgi:HAE1 family hydrophobic/amphiphilic exporter-1